jgi:hypothetical protein
MLPGNIFDHAHISTTGSFLNKRHDSIQLLFVSHCKPWLVCVELEPSVSAVEHRSVNTQDDTKCDVAVMTSFMKYFLVTTDHGYNNYDDDVSRDE